MTSERNDCFGVTEGITEKCPRCCEFRELLEKLWKLLYLQKTVSGLYNHVNVWVELHSGHQGVVSRFETRCHLCDNTGEVLTEKGREFLNWLAIHGKAALPGFAHYVIKESENSAQESQ